MVFFKLTGGENRAEAKNKAGLSQRISHGQFRRGTPGHGYGYPQSSLLPGYRRGAKGALRRPGGPGPDGAGHPVRSHGLHNRLFCGRAGFSTPGIKAFGGRRPVLKIHHGEKIPGAHRQAGKADERTPGKTAPPPGVGAGPGKSHERVDLLQRGRAEFRHRGKQDHFLSLFHLGQGEKAGLPPKRGALPRKPLGAASGQRELLSAGLGKWRNEALPRG